MRDVRLATIRSNRNMILDLSALLGRDDVWNILDNTSIRRRRIRTLKIHPRQPLFARDLQRLTTIFDFVDESIDLSSRHEALLIIRRAHLNDLAQPLLNPLQLHLILSLLGTDCAPEPLLDALGQLACVTDELGLSHDAAVGGVLVWEGAEVHGSGLDAVGAEIVEAHEVGGGVLESSDEGAGGCDLGRGAEDVLVRLDQGAEVDIFVGVGSEAEA